MSKIHSANNELFHDYGIDESIYQIISDGEVEDGDIITVYEGEKHGLKISDYINLSYLFENISENAYSALGGEYGSDSYLENLTDKMCEELVGEINKWADKHKLQPTFFGVKNIKEIKFKVHDVENNIYEEIGNPTT